MLSISQTGQGPENGLLHGGTTPKKGDKRWNVTPQRLRYRYRLLVRGPWLGPTHLTANRKLSPSCVLLSVTCLLSHSADTFHFIKHMSVITLLRFLPRIPQLIFQGPHAVLSFSLPFFLNLPPHLFISN